MESVPVQRHSAHPDFLIDTEEYRGISPQVRHFAGLVTMKLRRHESLQEQWLSAEPIQNSVAELFDQFTRLEIVIAGWVDQAVLEYHSVLQGDVQGLAEILNQLDAYRPDQNGDILVSTWPILITTKSWQPRFPLRTIRSVRRRFGDCDVCYDRYAHAFPPVVFCQRHLRFEYASLSASALGAVGDLRGLSR